MIRKRENGDLFSRKTITIRDWPGLESTIHIKRSSRSGLRLGDMPRSVFMGWTSVNECRDVDLRLKKESIVAFLCIAGGDQDMGALGQPQGGWFILEYRYEFF